MKRLIIGGIMFLIAWYAYCNYEPSDRNNGDIERPDIREIRPAINLDADSSARKFRKRKEARRT